MQKAICLLLVLIGSFQRLSAADVTVTATAATNGSANGELFVQVDNSVTEFPLNLVITYPNGFIQTVTLTGYTYQITGLPAGIYTVQVTNASGCLLTVDIEILNCKLLSGTASYLCSSQPTVCCKTLFLTGGEGGFNSTTVPNEMTFNTYHSLSADQFNAIATTVHQTALGIASDVLTNGTTSYDIIEQNELETNAPLVMKFDETGSLVWVWHNYPANDASEYRSSVELSNSGTSTNSGFRVFPNPSQGSLSCNVDVPKEGVIKLELMTSFGQKLLTQQSQYVSGTGSVTLQIREIENLPAGMYFLKLTNTDNVEKVERVVIAR